MARKGKYKTGHAAQEFDRQEHICFDYLFTYQEMKDAAQALNKVSVQPSKFYTFYVHPEMVKLLDKAWGDDIIEMEEN